MKIVVVGGKRLIGSKLVAKLREGGHGVAPTHFEDRLAGSGAARVRVSRNPKERGEES